MDPTQRTTRAARTLRKRPAAVSRHICLLLGAALLALAGVPAVALSPAHKTHSTSSFLPYIELAPFEVNGEKLAVSIHARTKSDRRYAEKFAEEVVGIAFETMEKPTGHGLVIIGQKGEPHPV